GRRRSVADWSGWRESNSRINLGKVAGYHYITPARPTSSIVGRPPGALSRERARFALERGAGPAPAWGQVYAWLATRGPGRFERHPRPRRRGYEQHKRSTRC